MTRKLTPAQKQKFHRPGSGAEKPPTFRQPAVALPVLSAEERLQELLEERRQRKMWDQDKLTASLKGYGSA